MQRANWAVSSAADPAAQKQRPGSLPEPDLSNRVDFRNARRSTSCRRPGDAPDAGTEHRPCAGPNDERFVGAARTNCACPCRRQRGRSSATPDCPRTGGLNRPDAWTPLPTAERAAHTQPRGHCPPRDNASKMAQNGAKTRLHEGLVTCPLIWMSPSGYTVGLRDHRDAPWGTNGHPDAWSLLNVRLRLNNASKWPENGGR